MSTYESAVYFTGNGTYSSNDPIKSNVGDFTPFYIAIAICAVVLGSILILNIYCCCSRYSGYWSDRHTGNRFIVSIWTTTPHKQTPLDLSELEGPLGISYDRCLTREYQDFPPSVSHQPLTSSQEFLELQKRESHI